jgi:tungstate transport system ATP-binding protein
MSEIAFRLQGVTRAYDGSAVLRVDALDIRRGEILALVGPSGAGKSTLLRLLNLIEPPSSGEIHFAGRVIRPHEEAPVALRRRVTTVFQRPIVLNRSVRANVEYGLHLRGRRDCRASVDQALEQVGLLGLAHRRARRLSGGEAQRVALARAIVLEPEVLLLDEPTANLDPYNVRLIEEIVADLNRRRGATVVLVTHNVFQAHRLAHRVGLLLEGRLVEVAETAQFFESPSDPRTAAFVRGEMVY